MRRDDIILETSLGRLLEAYADHCGRNGLRESSVQLYRKLALRFLKGLEDAGVTESAGIGPHEVFCTCLALKSNLLSVRNPYIFAVSCGRRIYPARLFLYRAAFQAASAHAPSIFGSRDPANRGDGGQARATREAGLRGAAAGDPFGGSGRRHCHPDV